jgi:hypothetical protein
LPDTSAILPADNLFNQRRTSDALLRIVDGSAERPGCPEPPRPDVDPADLVQILLSIASRSTDMSHSKRTTAPAVQSKKRVVGRDEFTVILSANIQLWPLVGVM